MNSRKIKLALTVGLLNNHPLNGNALHTIREMMQSFKDEVGAFLGLSRIDNARLNRDHIKETYAIRFEKCTLNVDLIFNSQTHMQIVQGFQLR